MDYDERSDVFSFGVVLLECILGTEVVKRRLERSPRNCFELDTDLARKLAPADCPSELLELALFCCAYEPNARPDFHDVLTALTNVSRNLTETVFSPPASSTKKLQIYDSDEDSGSSQTRERSDTGTQADDEADYLRRSLQEKQANAQQVLSQPIQLRRANENIPPPINHSDALSDGSVSPRVKRLSLDYSHLYTLNNSSGSGTSDSDRRTNKEGKYVRVESLVDAYTVWNVRVGPTSTVADVTENLRRKIDAKYTIIELYQIIGKKVGEPLLPEQFIEEIKARWGPQIHKFGVSYREGNDKLKKTWSGSINKNSPLAKVARKDFLAAERTKKYSKDKKKPMSIKITNEL